MISKGKVDLRGIRASQEGNFKIEFRERVLIGQVKLIRRKKAKGKVKMG